MNWKHSLLVFVSTIVFLFAGHAIAQTDININNTNLIRFGGDVTVQDNQVVENAHAIGGSVTVQPKGRVTQTAIAIGGNVTLKKGARVDGDAYAIGGNVVQEEGATIGGTKGGLGDEPSRAGMHRNSNHFLPMYLLYAGFRIFSAIVAAILGLILLKTAPSFLPTLAATVRQYPGKSALWGGGAIIALIAINIFLAMTLIGVPLIPLLSLIVSLTSLVGALGIALFVGQQVARNEQRSDLQQFLIGLLMITVLALIPVLGGIVVFVVSLLGLGALLAWKLGKVPPAVME